jgi:aminoglycoside/choline kinase family phosphotransferase
MKTRDEMAAFARESLSLPEGLEIDLSPLGNRGSDRTYFRIRWRQERSAILVAYDPGRVENGYFANIAAFLSEIGVPVPRVFRHDPIGCLMVMEDLGSIDLESLKSAPWEERAPLYQKTLASVHKLHALRADEFPSVRVRLMDPFGPDLYKWERDYFRDHFVQGVCGLAIDPSFGMELEKELGGLAARIDSSRPCLVHRDLQSQNVMVRDGEPFLIDFQGMRFGSLFYDLGSLLCDPYVEFPNGGEEGLLPFYYNLSKRQEGWAEFQSRFWEASVQRLMQALGAYGFLGLKRGLTGFLDHVPTALRKLRGASAHAATLPRLSDLLARCEAALRVVPGEQTGKP